MDAARIFLILLGGILLLSTPAFGSGFDFEISPIALFNSGQTDYTIEFIGYSLTSTGDTVLIGVRSKLEFPLDATLVGGDMQARKLTSSGKEILFTFGLLTDITDPNDKMYDHDWYFDPGSFGSRKFSYTESQTKLSYLLLKLEAAMSVKRGTKTQLALFAGFYYTKMKFDIMGYAGWQIGNDGLAYDMTGDPNLRVLYYEVTHKLPLIGARFDLTPSHQTRFSAQLAGGRLLSSDYDDHILRGKTAVASTSGWAFLAGANGRLFLTRHGSVRPFVTGRFEFLKQSASGSQTQEWYKDETYYNSDTGEQETTPAGTRFTGIDYETNTRQLRFGFGIGVAF